MTRVSERPDDFESRRVYLASLSDEELEARFWELCDQLTQPLVELAFHHTSPSIERSVLMRMGIDSLLCQGVVDRVQQAGLLGKGAGHVVLKVMEREDLCPVEAARRIARGCVLDGLFEKPGA